MSSYSFVIDNMRFSFSRLASFCQCKHEWYLQYIEGIEGDNNFYAEFGKYCHTILEKYARGELELLDLVDYFKDHFEESVVCDVNNRYSDIRDNYYNKGIEYFENIDLDLSKYEILGIEKECKFKIGKVDFIGYIDLLLRDKESGKIVLVDHKSSKYPLGKKGGVLKSEAKKYEQYKKQLYLYSKAVYEEYGEFPSIIGWNYFNARQWLLLDFNKEEYEEAIKWASGILVEINSEENFNPSLDFYYCHNLCRYRDTYCEYKDC